MGEKTGHIIWNKLDRLNVTPTEALVLLALAHFGIDDLPLCHPRQRHICRKTHLSMTAVKTSLAALKKSPPPPSLHAETTTHSNSCKNQRPPTALMTPPLQWNRFEGYLHHSVRHECH